MLLNTHFPKYQYHFENYTWKGTEYGYHRCLCSISYQTTMAQEQKSLRYCSLLYFSSPITVYMPVLWIPFKCVWFINNEVENSSIWYGLTGFQCFPILALYKLKFRNILGECSLVLSALQTVNLIYIPISSAVRAWNKSFIGKILQKSLRFFHFIFSNHEISQLIQFYW